MTGLDSRVITLDEAEALLAASVRPAIRGHAGDVHVVSVSALGDVTVSFSGACCACPLQPVTFGTSIQPALRNLPGVRSVRCETVRISSYAAERIARLMAPLIPQPDPQTREFIQRMFSRVTISLTKGGRPR